MNTQLIVERCMHYLSGPGGLIALGIGICACIGLLRMNASHR